MRPNAIRHAPKRKREACYVKTRSSAFEEVSLQPIDSCPQRPVPFPTSHRGVIIGSAFTGKREGLWYKRFRSFARTRLLL